MNKSVFVLFLRAKEVREIVWKSHFNVLVTNTKVLLVPLNSYVLTLTVNPPRVCVQACTPGGLAADCR